MICPKCKTHVDSSTFERAKFCSHCGNEIDYNRCSTACNLNSDRTFPLDSDEPRILDDKDLYCKFCGAKSTYLIQGIHEED